jgi:hypothetical protein
MERLNLDCRPPVAAIGRRVNTLWTPETGLRQPLPLSQGDHHFCVPHASLPLAVAAPELMAGTGGVKKWGPRTPAMAAGLTNRVGSWRAVRLWRVPPWLQPCVKEGRDDFEAGKSRRKACVCPRACGTA